MRKSKNGDKINGSTVIKVKVIPRSSRNQILGIHGDTFKIKLTSPPVDGKANKSLVALFAKFLGIPKKNITITAGEHSREKYLQIRGISREDIFSILHSITS